VVAGLIGVAAVWLGIVLAYDSYYWPPAGTAGRSASSWWPWSSSSTWRGAVTGMTQARRAAGLSARRGGRERVRRASGDAA